MIRDNYFLSGQNAVATSDQVSLENRALRLLEHPDVQKAKQTVTYLWLEVASHEASDQISAFAGMMDEYTFHFALRAAASDHQHPGVVRFMEPPGRWFGRNVPGSRWAGNSPNFCYRMIPVSQGSRYELHIRPTCDRPPPAFYALMGSNTAAPSVLGLLESLDLVTDALGECIITVDDKPSGGRPNHLQTLPGAEQIWIRDGLGDWSAQRPNALTVRLLDGSEQAASSDDHCAGKAARSMLNFIYYTYYCSRMVAARPPGEMSTPASSALFGGVATQWGAKANIVLAEDEAMIITANAAGACFRDAVLHDQFNLPLDYWDRITSLNTSQMAADRNGRFSYVVAHQDPHVYNWLDTGGRRQTLFTQRWQAIPKGVTNETPTITGRIVKLRELDQELSQEARRIDAEERARQLFDRKAGFALRFIDS